MIGLTTGLMLMLTPVTGGAARTTPVTLALEQSVPAATTTKVAAPKSKTTEDIVRAYFSDTPILAEVARCESTFAQYGADGKPLQGRVDPSDIGVMQINRRFHGDEAARLGLDLTTLEGNMAYAKHLYQREGVEPWSASAPCWSKTSAKDVARQ